MPKQKARLVVSSCIASLQQIEEALGENSQGGHNKGTNRSNGLPRQQSIWIQDWSTGRELLEDSVSALLDWLHSRSDALDKLDAQCLRKIICRPVPRSGQDCFAVNADLARRLLDLRVHLLIEFPLGNKARSSVEE